MPPKLERCVTGFMQDPKNIARYPDEKVRRDHAYAICQASLQSEGTDYIYAIDLKDVELADEGTWIQILPKDTIHHPVHGTFDFNDELLKTFEGNYRAGIRGQDLDIDYAHKNDSAKGEKAAGWIKDVKIDNGLWGLVQFTPQARKEIADGEWRYVSADFTPEWKDPHGKVYKNVLNGAALTNRPFVKGMAPINLSELDVPLDQFPSEPDEELEALLDEEGEVSSNYLMWEDGVLVYTPMKFRDIPASAREKIPEQDFAGKGRSFPIEKCVDVAAAFHSLGRAGADNYPIATIRSNIIRIAKRKGCALPKSVQAEEEVNMDLKEIAKLLGLKEDADEATVNAKLTELKTFHDTHLTEEDERARKFEEDYPEEAKLLKEQIESNKRKDADAQIKAWEAKGLAPAVFPLARGFMLGEQTVKLGEGSDAKEIAVTFDAVVDGILKAGIVKTKTETTTEHDADFDGDPQKEFAEKVVQYQEKHEKASYRDARSAVLHENKELAKRLLAAAPAAQAGE